MFLTVGKIGARPPRTRPSVKPAIFHPDAEAEFWRLSNITRSGVEALRIVSIRRFAPWLERSRPRPGGTGLGVTAPRRHRARRFPYAVIFAERPDRLHLVAVAHVKRHPDY